LEVIIDLVIIPFIITIIIINFILAYQTLSKTEKMQEELKEIKELLKQKDINN